MTTITLHHLEHSRSTRILWALEELGLDYTVREYKRDPKTLRGPAELRAIHPLGKAPVLVVDDVVLAESGAVLEYLVDRFGDGRLRPSDPAQLLRYRYWLHYAEGSLMLPMFVKLLTSRVRSAPVPFFLRPILQRVGGQIDGSYTDPEMARHLDFVEQALQEGPWFAGAELSAADIQMSYPLLAWQTRGGGSAYSGHPNIQAWLARVEALPAYQRAVERGGPIPF